MSWVLDCCNSHHLLDLLVFLPFGLIFPLELPLPPFRLVLGLALFFLCVSSHIVSVNSKRLQSSVNSVLKCSIGSHAWRQNSLCQILGTPNSKRSGNLLLGICWLQLNGGKCKVAVDFVNPCNVLPGSHFSWLAHVAPHVTFLHT